MVNITYGTASERPGKTLNAKERRHRKRKEEALAKLEERRKESELSDMSFIERKSALAASLAPPKDDVVMVLESKADAIHKVVNHAHQRPANKKWS